MINELETLEASPQVNTDVSDLHANYGGATASDWIPTSRQCAMLECPEREILVGGSRGGGKTDAGMAWMVEPEYVMHRKYKGLVVRRNADDLFDWVERAKQFYAPLGVKVSGKPVEFRFPSGAVIRCGHLKDENAYTKYQGQEYQKILIEELTHIPDEDSFERLLSSNRSTVPELTPRFFGTTNPGGPGHAWVKARYVDCAYETTYKDPITGNKRIFIPATIEDNPYLMQNDPGYYRSLMGLKDENLKKAWLYGDWDVFIGQFFGNFDPRVHVVKPFEINSNWRRFRSIDYAFADCCSCLWGATDHSGNLYIYREWLHSEFTPTNAAEKISALSGNERYARNIADPEMWSKKHEGVGRDAKQATMHSVYNKFSSAGIYLTQANNDRINGWQAIKDLLYHDANSAPKLFIFDNCTELIKHIPQATYSETKAEDMNNKVRLRETYGQYHWDDLDALRYLIMHIYSSSEPPAAMSPEELQQKRFNDHIDRITRTPGSKKIANFNKIPWDDR
jgi:hypothetical protein